MSEQSKKRVEKSRDPNVWKKWLEECVVTSSEVEQNDDSEEDEVQKNDLESQEQQRMDTSVNEFDTQSDDEDDSGSDEESGDSSDEEMESCEEEDSEDGEGVERFNVDENPGTVSSEDSSGNSGREQCPICLNKFSGQDLGTPESCEHTFCFECIQEWSKNINTCPIDRIEFNNIRVRATPDGNDIKKVKVKVRPKEAEDALEESVTQCEVCHHGDREDRLLLCDGCDLAYHCECLDPPLFYIPIEEWFCPPCSGILRNGAVAGPSHSGTRRVIPRTRASEAVRSRVQNLRRTQKSPAPRSSSTVSRKSTTPVKRKKRRTYRRAYKKVVQLARTKKSMFDAGKGKTTARGTTVVVTYRRRRRRRRRKCGTKKFSKSSKAYSKALSGPSAQQRIAKRLGISKSSAGPTMPQVKMPTSGGYRLGSRADKMPSHSLFGNKNQLMDFSENFNEVDINAPSTSRAVSVSRRSPEDVIPSVSAPVSILDSILAGQTLLHSKSENVVIKNDGSLILKNASTNAKKAEVLKKPEVGQSCRTPMSVALVKEGAKSLILEKLLQKKNNETKSTKKHIRSEESLKSHSSKTTTSQSERLSHRTSSSASSSNHKSSTKQDKYSKLFDEEKDKKSMLSAYKIPKRKSDTCKESEKSSSSNVEEDLNSITDYLQPDMPSDWESELSNPISSVTLNKMYSNVGIKKEKDSKSRNSSICSDLKSREKLDKNNSLARNVVSPDQSSVMLSGHTYIKKEVESDQIAESDLCEDTDIVHIKQEILSDEETNADCWIQNNIDVTKQIPVENHSVNIKKEHVDSDSDTNASEPCNFGNENANDETSESENSFYDASQSILDSVPPDSIYSSPCDKWKSKTPSIKVKEEIASDSEDYSQSLVSSNNVNLDSEPLSHNAFLEKSSQLKAKKSHISKHSNDLSDKSLSSSQLESFAINDKFARVEHLPSTHISPLEYDSSENKRSERIQKDISSLKKYDQASHDDDFPATQIDASGSLKESSSDSSDDELPPTQINPALLNAFSSSSRDISSKNIQNNLSLNPQIKPYSSEKTLLSQTNNSSIVSNKSTSEKLSSKQTVQHKGIGNLPEIQSQPETDEFLPSTQILSAQKEKSNLPNKKTDTLIEKTSNSSGRRIIWTSISGKESENKSESKVSAVNKKSSLKSEKSSFASKKVTKVAETQVNESLCLSTAQTLDESSSESYTSTHPETFSSVRESPDLPATQLLCSENVAESSFPATQLCNENVVESSLPATQIFHENIKEQSSLPATQIVDAVFKEQSLPKTQVVDATFKKPFAVPAAQILDETSASPSLPETQIMDYALSATQILESSQNKSGNISKNSAKSSENLVSDLNSSSQNQMQNKTSNRNITDILSNIKEIVNSLAKHSSHASKYQGDANDAKSTLDCDASLADSSESEKLVDTSINEMDEETSNASSANQEQNINASDSEDEELSPDKLKELLSKSGKSDLPRNVGVHRHLPQVITVKPVKQLLKPKPPNRKTFSFEEVAKLECPLAGKENYQSETNLENSCIENDDFPATQLAIWPERNEIYMSKTQMTQDGTNKDRFETNVTSSFCNQNENSKTDIVTKKKSSSKVEFGKDILPTSCDEHDLSTTQTCLSGVRKSLKPNKIRKLINFPDSNEVHLSDTQICDSSKDNSLKSHEKINQNIGVFSDDDESSLVVTQVISLRDENNFLKPLPKVKKEYIESDNDVNNLPAIQIQSFRDRHNKSNVSKSHATISECVIQNEEVSLNFDSDDLPATQIFCDTPVQNSDKFECSAVCNDKIISKNDISANSKHKKSALSFVTENNKNTRKHNESIDYLKNTSMDSSFIDSVFDKKKQNKNNEGDSNKDHSKGPERSNKNEQNEKELNFKNHALTVPHIKLEPPENEKISISAGERENCKMLAANSAKERLDHNSIKISETILNLEGKQAIKIKQEKIDDFNFEKPLQVSETMHHSVLKNVALKIKSEESFDDESLPSTQIVNFDAFDNNSLPPTQIFCNDQGTSKNITSNSNRKSNHGLEILLPVHIKEEILSDDEISVIEVKDNQEINEIISIDDDLENTSFDKSSSHTSNKSYRKDLIIKSEKDAKYCKIESKKEDSEKNISKISSKSKSDKIKTVDNGKHSNLLVSNLHDKEDKFRHDSKSSKLNSKSKDSKNGFRDIEKRKNSTENRLLKNENNKSKHNSETSVSRDRDTDYCKDTKTYEHSKNSTVSKESKTKHDNELSKSKSKHNNSKSTSADIGKRKSSTDSISSKEGKKTKYDTDLSKSVSKTSDFEKLKKSRDLAAVVKKDSYKKHETDLKSQTRDHSHTDKTKNSKQSSKSEKLYEKNKTDSHSESRRNLKKDKLLNFQRDVDHSKHLNSHYETNGSSEKVRLARSSSEKENDTSFKTNLNAKEFLVTLKPSSRKRSHETSITTDQKKFKSDESSNSTSFSDEFSSRISALQNGSHKDKVRTSSVSSMDWSLNDNSHDFLGKESPEAPVKRELKMISRKQELKEEIANEVKLVLKPFYSTSLISKEDYKDIMRRAVPKIFMNCHNCINPDKIRKLVLSYVSLLNKS